MAIDNLTMLQAELNMRSAPATRLEQLQQLLDVAASRIKKYGITLDLKDPSDAQLQVEYAAWLYRRRAQADAAIMPTYLSHDLKDRLIAEKARVTDGI